MRIVDRYLITEVFTTQLAVGFVLGLVIVGGTFVRLLGLSVGGNLPVDLLTPLVAVESLKAAILLTPVALFLAGMLTLARLYRDSEMTALQAAGVGQGRLYLGLMSLAVPLALGLAYMMLFVFPWASAKSNHIQHEGRQRMSVAAVAPGRFFSLAGGKAVGFVDALKDGGTRLNGIFVHASGQRTPVLILAQDGTQHMASGGDQRTLTLDNGIRYDGQAGQGNYRILRFQRYEAVILMPSLEHAGTRLNARSSLDLWRSGGRSNLAELEWRLSIPLSALILTLIAIPLSYARPRQGRFGQIALAILIYAAYANLIFIAKAWMVEGSVPIWVGLWWPHVLLLILGVGLWKWRSRQGLRLRRRRHTDR